MSNLTVVTNTSPLLALIAATGSLTLLQQIFHRVIVPHEVSVEIEKGGTAAFGTQIYRDCTGLEKRTAIFTLDADLQHLGSGEASVIQTARNESIANVVIDEKLGRKTAANAGLHVIGSIGILIEATKQGMLPSLRQAIEQMERQGIFISPQLKQAALHKVE